MYFTDAGIEELDDRRGEEQVTMSWLAERLRDFVDLNPEFETAVDRLASWLARLDSDGDPDAERRNTRRSKSHEINPNGCVSSRSGLPVSPRAGGPGYAARRRDTS